MSDDIVKYLRLSRTRFNRHAEAADEIERLRADRDRWRALAEYLCQNTPSVVVPDEIACQFPNPLAVADE